MRSDNTSFALFAIITAVLLYVLQQSVLLFVLCSTEGSTIWLVWIIWDVPLALYLLFGAFLAKSSITVAVQWMLYSFGLAGKLAIFYFVVHFKDLRNVGLSVQLALFLTPIINVLLVHQARSGPGGMFVSDKDQLSVEGILHSDVMVHVALDLLDLMVAYSSSHRYNLEVKELQWLHFLGGVVVVLGVVLLGFAFPAISSDNKALNKVENTDMFITAKHSTLVGIFVIDGPLLLFRIGVAVLHPDMIIDLFMFKNIICLPYRSFRLHQSRIAERERAKGYQKAFYDSDFVEESSAVPSSTSGSVTVGSIAGADCRRRSSAYGGSVFRHTEDGSILTRPIEESVGGGGGGGPVFSELHFEEDPNAYTTYMSSEHFLDPTLKYIQPTLPVTHVPPPSYAFVHKTKQHRKYFKQLLSIRRLPVEGFSCWSIFVKFCKCLCFGRRMGKSILLDREFSESYWRQLRLIFPQIFFWIFQLVIVALYWLYTDINDIIPNIFDIRGLDEIMFADLFGFLLCTLLCCIIFMCYVVSAPIVEVIVMCLFSSLRLLSFQTSVRLFHDYLLVVMHENALSRITIAIWAWAVIPFFSFVCVIQSTICAVIGRKYVFWFWGPRDATGTPGVAKNSKLVTTTSALIFVQCRHQFAPPSYHKLLISVDLIKSVRLMEGLKLAHWRDVYIVGLIRFWILTISFDYPQLGIFCGHVLGLMIYPFICQALRLMTLRTYEIRYLFEVILTKWGAKAFGTKHPDDASDEDDEAMEAQGVRAGMLNSKTKNYITLADLDTKFSEDGFFSSPGMVLPVFF